MPSFADWPSWAGALFWTVVTLAAAYAVGHIVRAIVESRLRRFSARTSGQWDDALVVEFRRRVPFWSLLAGVYLALPYWPLPQAHYDTIVKVLAGCAIASITFGAAAVATGLVTSYGARVAPATPVSALTQNVVRAVIIVLGVLAVVRVFGTDISPYLAALGVGGLAVALAVQDPLSNFFAGIFMSASGQVRIGNYIKLDSGAEGYVADVNWRATSIRMLTNNIIIVPNAKLAQATITNFDLPSHDLSLPVDVGVHYFSDLAAVERTTLDVAREVMARVPGGVKEFEPFVRYQAFGEKGITFTVMLRVREFTDQALVKHEFIKRLHVRYEQDRIVVPFTPVAADPRVPSVKPAEKAGT